MSNFCLQLCFQVDVKKSREEWPKSAKRSITSAPSSMYPTIGPSTPSGILGENFTKKKSHVYVQIAFRHSGDKKNNPILYFCVCA